MPTSSKILKRTLLGAAALVTVTSTCFASPITATITDVKVGSDYDYTINLSNPTGLTFGTFWFAWVPGGFFLTTGSASAPTQPSDFATGAFVSANGGSSVRWESIGPTGSGVTDPSDIFTFKSTETPADLLSSSLFDGVEYPDLTFFIYAGNNNLSSALVEGPVVAEFAPTPEPSSLIFVLTGAAGLAGGLRRKLLNRA
jgi:hypothetical protein